jgi:hypothetical protein
MATDTVGRDGMLWPAAALVVTQVVHAAVPTKGELESEGPLGLIFGLVFLGLSVAGLLGIVQRRPYGRPLTAWTGLAVGLGFAAYHAVPWHGWFTNPYFGEPVGPWAWSTVAACLLASAWCVSEGRDLLAAGVGRPAATR